MIIISPAKKQVESVNKKPWSIPKNLMQTQILLDLLSSMDCDGFMTKLHISKELARLCQRRLQMLLDEGFDTQTAIPAVYLYAGDVYRHLDVGSLQDEHLVFMQQNLRIISAFYGLLSPMDGIWPYRLEMTTRLDDMPDLAKFWQDSMTNCLMEHEQEYVFNLASQAYSQCLDRNKITNWVDIVFQDKTKEGRYQVVAVKAKRMRGRLLRYMVENQIKTPELLWQFDEQGYQLNEELSSKNCLVFRS